MKPIKGCNFCEFDDSVPEAGIKIIEFCKICKAQALGRWEALNLVLKFYISEEATEEINNELNDLEKQFGFGGSE